MRATVLSFCVLMGHCTSAQTWLDPTFGVGGAVEVAFSPIQDRTLCAAIQPDGKILVAGEANLNIGPVGLEFLLARFEADGTIDTSFGLNGMAAHDIVVDGRLYDIAVQPDGKIVAVGYAKNMTTLEYHGVVLRFESDGAIDPSFADGGIRIIDAGTPVGVELQSDGKIIIVGLGGFYVARFNDDGTFDSTFAGGAGQFAFTIIGSSNCWAHNVAIMDDGRIVSVGGCVIPGPPFTAPVIAGAVIRYLADGTLDASFGDNGVVLLDQYQDVQDAQDVTVYADGRILVTGSFCYSCTNETSVTNRILEDGSRDMGFGDGGHVVHRSGPRPTRGESVVLDGSGTILIGGTFRPSNSEMNGYVTRLLENGTPDGAFGMGGELLYSQPETSVVAEEMLVQPDGKIILAGHRSPISQGSHTNVFLLRYLTEPFVGVEDVDAEGIRLINADALGVKLDMQEAGSFEFMVLDAQGRVVDQDDRTSVSKGIVRLDFAAPLLPGSYLLSIRSRTWTSTRRFVVVR